MKKSGQAGEVSEVASKKAEAKQGVTSIQQLGYSNFQRQANTCVKRSSVRSLRETFENAIRSETPTPTRANGVTPSPKESRKVSPPRTESKRLSRFDLSRIPVKNRKPQPVPETHYTGKGSAGAEREVRTTSHNGTFLTTVSHGKSDNKVPGVVSNPYKIEGKAEQVVIRRKPEASEQSGKIVTRTSDGRDKNRVTDSVQYPLRPESKDKLVSVFTVSSTVSSIPVSTSRENGEPESPKSAKSTHNRLSASQLVIERLQQNLSTKLSPETIETLKRSYSPAIKRKLRPSSLDSPKSLDCLDIAPPKSFILGSVPSKRNENVESPKSNLVKRTFVDDKTISVTESNEDRVNNNSEPIRKVTESCLENSRSVEDTVLRKFRFQETNFNEDSVNEKSVTKKEHEINRYLTNGVLKDYFVSSRKNTDIRPLSHPEHLLGKSRKNNASSTSESTFNSESSSFEEYFSSPELRNPRSRCSSADTDYSFYEEKPKRVSWTTSLLQKLTHDRPAKKVKVIRKLRDGKLVRYPEENTLSAEERFKLRHASHAKKYAEHLPGLIKQDDNKADSQPIVYESASLEPEHVLYVKRSDIVKDTDKDAYASLITKLAEDDENSEVQKKSTEKNLSSDKKFNVAESNKGEESIYVKEHIDYAEKEKQLLENLASDSDYSDLSDPEIIHEFVASEKSFLENQERAKRASETCEQLEPTSRPIPREIELSGKSSSTSPEVSIIIPANKTAATCNNTSFTEVDTNTCKESQTNITAATKEKSQGGKRSQEEKEKPSGLRRLFFNSLFSSPKRHNAEDRKISSQETVKLLTKGEQQNNAQKQANSKYIGDSKIHPSTNKPIIETAFLTNVPKKELRPKAPTPEIYSKGQHNYTSGLQDENSRRNAHLRSRSLSPRSSRGRSSAEPQLSPNRTIPDTSLIIEERLQKIRHENQPPKRPSSTPLKPTKREDLFHRNNSLPYRVATTSYPVKRNDSPPTPTNDLPNNYHIYQNYANANAQSQQPQIKKGDDHTDEAVRCRNSISSCSSSSTIVPHESPVPWNPTLVELDQHTTAGRKGKEGTRNVIEDVVSNPYFRHSVPASETKFKEIRRGPVLYHPSELQNFSGVPVSNFNEPFRVQHVPVSSGRISAPPAPYSSHYAKPRAILPTTNNTSSNKSGPYSLPSTYGYSNNGLLIPAYAQPKHISPELKLKEESQRSRSLSPQYQRHNVGTYSKVTSPLAREANKTLTDQEKEAVYQHLRARSISPLSSYSPDSSGSSPGQQNFPQKLSRQEVEALYWDACRKRSTSQQLSPVQDPRLRGQYTSTGSLPGHAQHKSDDSALTRRQQVSMGSLGGSAQFARPQPIYQNAGMSPQSPVISQQRSGRSRSVSPGPNLRGMSGRSLSLPRHVPATLSIAPQPASPGYFERGSGQRSTIGPIHMHRQSSSAARSTPTIYEEANSFSSVELRHPEKLAQMQAGENAPYPRSQSAMDVGTVGRKQGRGSGQTDGNKNREVFYHPIFKRGSLISNSTSSMDGTLTDSSSYAAVGPPPPPKRVSFTNQQPSRERSYWPTRNGLAPEPPTRQKKSARVDSSDSDVFLPSSPRQPGASYGLYVNVGSLGQPQAPDRPLPPVPRDAQTSRGVYGTVRHAAAGRQQPGQVPPPANRWQQQSESESGSEAGEVQRIMQQGAQRGPRYQEEEWGGDGKTRGQQGSDQSGGGGGRDEEVRRGGGGRSGRRDEPRRHTLSGDHHQPHQGGPLARSMDLEMSSKSQRRKSPLPRGYPPPSSAMLFDDDPGIMSEVETSSTGFRRGGKQRSSLPVVRTPSKTLERPLGLVFLQYRNETKRALLPNEITSIDTVKALFVRSFPKQLTMEYLDSPHVKIYIHDSSKDMFYELEDHRSHLRDIRDRSVLRLFEAADVNGGVLPGAGVGVMAPSMWDQDQSYFSEPEFDSEYQHQHIHKSKTSSKSSSSGGPPQPYYMTHSYPPGGPGAPATLPRGGPLLRAYSPAVVPPIPAERIKTLPQTDRLHAESGYMSSPERGGSRAYPGAYAPGAPGYEDPYYSQYASRSGSITPVIDEEARIRVEHMERQLANLTGLVQKALTQTPSPREYLQVPTPSRDANYRNATDEYDKHSSSSSASLPDKSVSFEKSVSFSDEPPDMNSPKQHSPQHAERTERERHKPAPPPKPVSLSPGQYEGRHVYRDLQLTPEMYNQLRGLQKKAKDLRQEVRNLRRMSQAQAHTVRETIRDTFIKIRAMLLSGGEEAWASTGDAEKVRLSREEDAYKQEMLRLEKDLTELESTVEELRSNVINRKTRVNMSDVENMALILSKSSKTVADLKVRFPNLSEGMKSMLSSEMEKVVREEKFLKEEPERLESALRRCKKLTGTLVTLKRLASVQEQRLPPSGTPDSRLSPTLGADSDTPITPPAHGKFAKIGKINRRPAYLT